MKIGFMYNFLLKVCIAFVLIAVILLSIGALFKPVPQDRTVIPAPVTGPALTIERVDSLITLGDWIPKECQSIKIDKINDGSMASVVIVSKNEDEFVLLSSVASVLERSESYLKNVVIVDDYSRVPVRIPEKLADKFKIIKDKIHAIKIYRTSKTLGVSRAKAFGASKALEDRIPPTVLVFLDAHVIVSNNWLPPLISTLQLHPQALVYPAMDVLISQNGRSEIVLSDNVVGAFDWSLRFRWEFIDDKSLDRIKVLSRHDGSTPANYVSMTASPASPGIFAIRSSYYHLIGGFDTSLTAWGIESVELSIRTWLCGGIVIRQPCSRVAHYYHDFSHKKSLDYGITQGEVDRDVLSIAERYMSLDEKETVFQARFLGRVPYFVDLSRDSRFPSQFMTNLVMTSEANLDFGWFLKEVYPGLLQEVDGIRAFYEKNLHSAFLDNALQCMISNYTTPSKVVVNPQEILAIKRRIEMDQSELVIQQRHDRLRPEPAKYVDPFDFAVRSLGEDHDIAIIPKKSQSLNPVKKQPSMAKLGFTIQDLILPENDAHEKHANHIRRSLSCEDEPAISTQENCEQRMKYQGGCDGNNRGYMMFGCPKSCGWCDNQGYLCIDFYENKCKTWKAEGRCDSEPNLLHHICRSSCNQCNKMPTTGSSSVLQKSEDIKNNDTPQESDKVDPYVAQKLLADGKLSFNGRDACSIHGKPHGELLSHVAIANNDHSARKVRIFCGIYTMAKNHETNVKATRDTWGKNCDGFLAFSTLQDNSIPAIKIDHEGEESYDNMWQKSRSIWKYIGKHFLQEFDFFLLGGDDMFYIIENLRAYLVSPDIYSLWNSHEDRKGVFLGRRFFPPKQEVFNSGGAGYLLDQKAVEVLVANLDSPKCFPHQKGFWEDVNVANCLRVSASIVPMDTRDEFQRERFHPFTPGQHLVYRIPKGDSDWYPKYNPYLKEGLDCCSAQSISFHYVPADLLRQLYGYVYHCSNKEITHNYS